MDFSEIARRLGKFAADNSPAILTAVAVSGVATTAYLTGRATFKYMEVLAEEGYYDRDYKFERPTKEHLEKAWKLYIPAAGTGLLTVACIIGANRISDRRAAALASAYSLAQKGFGEYRTKVIEKIGETKERQVQAEVAQDRLNNNPVSTREVFITSGGDVLCMDVYSARYFTSDGESLRKIQNDLNEKLLAYDTVSLSEYYQMVGLRSTKDSEELGWRVGNGQIELKIEAGLAEDGRPCLVIDFNLEPVRNYYRNS